MEISKGQVAAVAIIIAVLAQGLGGFLANAETKTTCTSQFDYLTDVYGSFKGTGQDIPVDFNPRENVTGYYAYDPTDPVQSQQIKNTPAIIYDPATTANNYPYINQPMDVKKYSVLIECPRDRTGDDWDSGQEEYKVTVTEYADGAEHTYGPITWRGSSDRQNPAWYSGVYHESLGHLTNSRIWIQGEMHQAPRIINLMDLYNHLDGIGDESLSLFDGSDLNLTCRDVSSAYPVFMADLTVDEDKSIFHDTFNLISDSEYSSYCYLNRSTGTVEIHASNYAVTSQWLAFGSSSTDSEIELDVLSHKMDPKARYIDPRAGVSPSHQASEYTYSEDRLYFAEEFKGGMEGFAASRPDLTGVFSLAVEIGEQPDRDTPEDYDTKDLLKCTIRAYGEGQGPQGHQVMACEFSLQDSSTVVFNPVFDLSQYGPTYDYYISWSFTETEVHIEAWAGQDSMRRTYDGDLSDITGTVVRQSVHTHMEEDHGQMMTAENLWVTDSYGGSSGRDPDYRSTHGELNEDLEVGTAMYQVVHEYITVPFSSEATYWNNGYGDPTKDPTKSGNGNSLIGIVLSTKPYDEDGDALPTETPFNICMHYEDPANPGKYLNTWLYNDPLKKGISVWADYNTGMAYIGHYNAEGIRQDASAMKIGVCDHVYVELRVDKGMLSVWAAPIYEFASFLDYKASPLMDQTQAVIGILPADHPQYKSMAQLSYNVRPVGVGPYTMGETVQTWTSGGCIVTLDEQGNLTVAKRDGGDGRMTDYTPSAPQRAPWLAQQRDATRIIVMDGVTHIGDNQFISLPGIEGIKIQSTVTSIGNGTFSGCYSVEQIEFAQEEWAVTEIGSSAFRLGTSVHPASCTVSSPGNNALGRLNAYGGEFTTFAYADTYVYPDYPRQLVVKTIILLDGGGLYVQDGVFHPNLDYPNSPLAELVINAVVHPGGTVTLGTTDDGGNMTTLLTMENDGVDKWISFRKANGDYLWEGQKFDWWDVHIFYVSNKIGEVEIEGEYYSPQMYLPDGTKLAQNHVYVQAGKYGDVEDIGAMVEDEHGMSDLTVRMGGVWAFSTQFNNGTNIQGSQVVWNGSAWSWDMNSTMVVFALTMLMASIVLFYKYGYNIYDILLLGGSLALLWVSFTG